MKRLPTDLQILNAIYNRYYDAFTAFSEGDDSRSTKIYVPIDIDQIAGDLRVDGNIVFGRLYYHLEKKHGYNQDGGASVHLFSLRVRGDHHCVNFPLMASVLADLRDKARKHQAATWIAICSLIIAIVSIVISILGQRSN